MGFPVGVVGFAGDSGIFSGVGVGQNSFKCREATGFFEGAACRRRISFCLRLAASSAAVGGGGIMAGAEKDLWGLRGLVDDVVRVAVGEVASTANVFAILQEGCGVNVRSEIK